MPRHVCRLRVRVCAIIRAYDACFSLNKFWVGFDIFCWDSTTTSSFLFFHVLLEIALAGACATHRMNVINLLEIFTVLWGRDLRDNHMFGIYISLFSVTRTKNFCSTYCVCNQMAVCSCRAVGRYCQIHKSLMETNDAFLCKCEMLYQLWTKYLQCQQMIDTTNKTTKRDGFSAARGNLDYTPLKWFERTSIENPMTTL